MEKKFRNPNPLLSLLVPVFNEEESIENFLQVIQETLKDIQFEILFIDDGSKDKTFKILKKHQALHSFIRIFKFSRNFGKEAALSCGLDHAQGDVVVPMDVDLQDPPELIHDFLAKWREGYDVVYGVREDRSQDSKLKALTAKWFYNFFNKMSSVDIPFNAGDFRLLDRRVVEVLKTLPERNRFMKGLFSWVGFPSIGVLYSRPARSLGSTKFNYWKLWNFALDGVLGFSTVPLRIWTYVGSVIAFLSFLYASFIVIRVLIAGVNAPGYASLITVVLFIGGVQLISLGIMGEYLGRLFGEVKQRPIYILEEVLER